MDLSKLVGAICILWEKGSNRLISHQDVNESFVYEFYKRLVGVNHVPKNLNIYDILILEMKRILLR